ncbi:MAG: DNA-directed RNA polymerase subunit D [Candidatus Woesearchaeota archaeon]
MEVTLLSKEKKANRISFVLGKSSTAFANALRRCAIESVPTLAIEYVEFRKNTSALYDEVVAHRLGLIPIHTDLSSYKLPSECPCGGVGCAQCQLKLTLKEKGPKTVYASDIVSSDPKAKPVYPGIPIVKLLKGQNLEIELIAILGIGKDHTKWSPGSVYYKYLPTIKISKKGESCIECVEACPIKVFVKNGSKLEINDKRLMDCHLCKACEQTSGGEVTVDDNVHDFVFYVESWGQLKPEEVLIVATEYLDRKLDSFLEEFNKTG